MTASRISRSRKAAYAALAAGVAIAALVAAARIYDAFRFSPPAATTEPVASGSSGPSSETSPAPSARQPPPSPHAGIDDGLRVQCVAGPDECEAAFHQPLSLCHRPDCENGIVTTTPQGFIGPKGRIVDEAKPAGVFRIVALGGSTTGGAAWAQGWPGQLEAMLTERAAREQLAIRFEVLNLGVPTAGSAELVELYRAIGRRYRADVVILGEEVNDLANCAPFRMTVDPSTGESEFLLLYTFLHEHGEARPLASLSGWFARHQSAFERERLRLSLDAAGQTVREAVAPRREAQPAPSGQALALACEGRAADASDDAPSIFDDFDEGWAYTKQRYDTLRSEATADQVSDLVVSTIAHDFDDWRCPTPTCLAIPSLHDWQSYITRVHNPALRRYAAENHLLLADLERVVDDFAAGRNETPAPLARILAADLGAPAEVTAALAERFARGALGKQPLFNEWMHPQPRGYAVMAGAYASVLWPRVVEAQARAH